MSTLQTNEDSNDDIFDCFKMKDTEHPNDSEWELDHLNENAAVKSSPMSVSDVNHRGIDINKNMTELSTELNQYENDLTIMPHNSVGEDKKTNPHQEEIELAIHSKEFDKTSTSTTETCDWEGSNFMENNSTIHEKNNKLQSSNDSNQITDESVARENVKSKNNIKNLEKIMNSTPTKTEEELYFEGSTDVIDVCGLSDGFLKQLRSQLDVPVKSDNEHSINTSTTEQDQSLVDAIETMSNVTVKTKYKRKLQIDRTNTEKEVKKPKTKTKTQDTNTDGTSAVKFDKGTVKYPRFDVTKEDVLKTLDLNWSREIVYRATTMEGRRQSDVYYKSPAGKKLRSLPEIDTYLKQTNDPHVEIGWFTFRKSKLTDHPNETVREAFKRDSQANSSTNESNSGPDTAISGSQSPMKKQATSKVKKRKSKTDTVPSISEDLNPMCSDRCEGYEGQLPDLMCISCYCLFHPKCVNIYSSDEHSDFTCKNCLRQKRVSITGSLSLCGSDIIKKQKIPADNNCNRKNKVESSSTTQNKKIQKMKNAGVKNTKPELKSTNSVLSVEPTVIPPDQILDSVHHHSQPEAQTTNNDWYVKLEGCDLLVKIFQHLNTKDLLSVRRTCKTWNVAASQPSLWRCLYLQDIKVTNWELLADCLKSNNVDTLNMRGMQFKQNTSVMWREFVAIIPRLSIIGLNLCRVPAPVIYRLTLKLVNLKCFSAEGIFDAKPDVHNQGSRCKLFIGKFNKMTELRELRLRGVQGLYVPDSALGDGFSNLNKLAHLQELSLTSFTETTACDLEFLHKLSDLTVLELGDCTMWKSEHYAAIKALKQLKRLRLEYGGYDALKCLNDVLINLTNLMQLELVLFPIPLNFGDALEQMKCLRTLIVWPEMKVGGAKNSYNLITALKKIPHLKKCVWGLVAPDINKQMLNGRKIDDKYGCIPFIMESRNAGLDVVELVETKISAGDLMEHVRAILPVSTIRVVMISSSSYSSVKQVMR